MFAVGGKSSLRYLYMMSPIRCSSKLCLARIFLGGIFTILHSVIQQSRCPRSSEALLHATMPIVIWSKSEKSLKYVYGLADIGYIKIIYTKRLGGGELENQGYSSRSSRMLNQ